MEYVRMITTKDIPVLKNVEIHPGSIVVIPDEILYDPKLVLPNEYAERYHDGKIDDEHVAVLSFDMGLFKVVPKNACRVLRHSNLYNKFRVKYPEIIHEVHEIIYKATKH